MYTIILWVRREEHFRMPYASVHTFIQDTSFRKPPFFLTFLRSPCFHWDLIRKAETTLSILSRWRANVGSYRFMKTYWESWRQAWTRVKELQPVLRKTESSASMGNCHQRPQLLRHHRDDSQGNGWSGGISCHSFIPFCQIIVASAWLLPLPCQVCPLIGGL